MRKDYQLEKRKYVIGGFILVIVCIYIIRLLGLQVMDSRYKEVADSNAFMRKTLYPSRGMIRDRNDKLVVYNQPAYDVMMIPKNVQAFDTLDFCRTLGITREQFDRRLADMKDRRLNPGYSAYTPQRFITHISAQDYGRLQEKLYRFPGFFIQQRILRQYDRPRRRQYPRQHTRGVTERNRQRRILRARRLLRRPWRREKLRRVPARTKGVEILIRDAYGRIKGKYENGIHDIAPVSGRDLKLSIDIDLQEYGEKLMANKIGAIVAIEPATGEILAMVSSPTYDPRLLVGRDRGKHYNELVADLYKPLFDRALKGAYPPGSTFKPSQGLILRQENIITLSTAYPCYHGFISGGLKVGCHGHASPITLKPALQTSCNAFFCWGLKSMLDNNRSKYGSTAEAFEVWKRHLVSLGYGYRLGVDLPGEGRGFIPNAQFYNKIYGEGRWSANTIISIAIGQGEILATPLQIANLCATIANRGWFVTPHIVKEIQDTILPKEITEKRVPTIDRQHFVDVAEGMRMAVLGGTCRLANLKDVAVAGKTGTAQNPHGKDHSAFIGFAPTTTRRLQSVFT